MWNVIRAVQHHNKLRRFLLPVGILLLLQLLTSEILTVPANTGSQYAGETTSMMSEMFLLPIIIYVTAHIAGYDLDDKTINYETLFGKRRAASYFGRFAAALPPSLLCAGIFPLPCTLIAAAVNGWGESMTVQNALQHYALIFPVVFRAVCFCTMLCFVLKSGRGTLILGEILCYLGTLATLLLRGLNLIEPEKITWQTSFFNLFAVIDFSNSTQRLSAEGADILVFNAEVTGTLTAQTLAASFGFGLLWLAVGYLAFRRADMK